MNKTPHKHAALIKQWADGAKIQRLTADAWYDCSQPVWNKDTSYRIKPESKPDEVVYNYHERGMMCSHGWLQRATSNVKYTYDGETGKLKAVELV